MKNSQLTLKAATEMNDFSERFKNFVFSNPLIAMLFMPFIIGMAGFLVMLQFIIGFFSFVAYCFKSDKK